MTPARAFELVPFGARAGEGALACDGLVDGDGAVHLSHWPGNRTPRAWMHDTSVGIALGYVARRGAGDRSDRRVVNNHFDTDGALAVYALLDPERALAHGALLVAAAEAGDFDEWPADERGLWLDAAVRAIGASAGDDARAYRAVFAALPALLDDGLERHTARFERERDALHAARRRAEQGALRVERVGAIAVLHHAPGEPELPGPVLSRATPTGCTRWLLAFEQPDGGFAYRYERRRWAWADTVVRPTLRAPSRNAIAQDLGPGWALKGELGMTGLVRTVASVRTTPRAVAERLARHDPGAG